MTQRLEVVDLIQRMIRNECVNDGTPESGQERRNVDLLESELGGSGVDFEVFEPTPGRASLVGRIEESTRRLRRCAGSGTPTSCQPTPTHGLGIRSVATWSTARSGVGVPSTC